MSFVARIAGTTIAQSFFAIASMAQVEQATILGTVTDSSGDVVPGASVSVLNSGPGNDGPHGPTIAAITRLRR